MNNLELSCNNDKNWKLFWEKNIYSKNYGVIPVAWTALTCCIVYFFSPPCYFLSSDNIKFFFIWHPSWGCIRLLHCLLVDVAPQQNLSFNTSGPWYGTLYIFQHTSVKTTPQITPFCVKTEIPVALYEELNFSAFFQCFGKRMVRGAQLSAEHLSVPTLQLVGSWDTAGCFFNPQDFGSGHLGKEAALEAHSWAAQSRLTQVQRRGDMSEVA